MVQIIQQLSLETGITVDDINNITIAILNLLASKVPAIKQVVEDVFDNVEPDELKRDINKLILMLQEQQCKETFGNWIMPQRIEITHREKNCPLF
jgi:hypothetical protein